MAGPPFTLDTTHPAPTNLVSAFPTNETTNRTNLYFWLSWLSDPTTGLLLDQAFKPGQIFPAGGTTSMVFYQAAAPTGWVKQTAVNDATFRIIGSGNGGGTGGLYGFTTIMSLRDTADTTLNQTMIPAHVHTYSGTTGNENANHSHAVTVTGTTDQQGLHSHTVAYSQTNTGSGQPIGTGGQNNASQPTSADGIHGHNVTASGNTGAQIGTHGHPYSGTTSSIGGGLGHHHAFSMEVLYADVIICSRT